MYGVANAKTQWRKEIFYQLIELIELIERKRTGLFILKPLRPSAFALIKKIFNAKTQWRKEDIFINELNEDRAIIR